MDNPLTVVGLTGGIATGKSAVARILRRAGLPVIDADSLGHMVLEPDGAAYAPVLDAFGKGILGVDAVSIDRQKLGGLVFDDPDKRALLESLTHPAIAKLAKTAFSLVAERGETMAVYEAALLVETGLHGGLRALIVVSCPLAVQLERLVARDGFSKKAAAARIASQLPMAEKLKVADYVVDNGGTFDQLEARVLEVATLLRNRFGNGDK
jgi:dephospho-CoA kinase